MYPRKPKRILVVDDEPMLCEILSEVLENEGYAVETAHCGQTALELTRDIRFDLVITDVRMPNGSGIELLQGLLTQDDPPSVFFVSAHLSCEESLDLGASAYFDKPVNISNLLGAVAATCRTRLYEEYLAH